MVLQYHSHPTPGYLHIAFLIKYTHDKIDHHYIYIYKEQLSCYTCYRHTSHGLWLASLLTSQTFLTRKKKKSSKF